MGRERDTKFGVWAGHRVEYQSFPRENSDVGRFHGKTAFPRENSDISR